MGSGQEAAEVDRKARVRVAIACNRIILTAFEEFTVGDRAAERMADRQELLHVSFLNLIFTCTKRAKVEFRAAPCATELLMNTGLLLLLIRQNMWLAAPVYGNYNLLILPAQCIDTKAVLRL